MIGKIALAAMAAGVTACGASSSTVTVPGPTVTVTVAVTRTAAATVTKTAAPAPPKQGAVLLDQSGDGSQATRSFTVPADGDYLVSWTFSGNTDPSFGGASNFIVTEPGDFNSLTLPDVIESSGSGSTEVTGDSGAHVFDVQAVGSWTIRVTAAS